MGEFDGIEERKEGKTRMPLGMTVLFIGLAVFGMLYWYLFSPQTTGWTQKAQYEHRIEKMRADIIRHETKEVESGASGAGQAEDGIDIYRAHCAMCHGDNLEGGGGPALTGPKFVYGSTLSDLVRVITDGTPKGMPAFGKELGPDKVRAVAHYVHFKHTK